VGEIVSGTRRLTTADLQVRAARAANGLRSLGIGQGDLIALYLRNDLAFFEASAAAGILGAYPTPVNWHYTPDEARYLFENSGAKAIIIHADLLEPIRSAIPANVPVLTVATPPEIAGAYGIPPQACVAQTGTPDWSAWLESFEPYSGPPKEAPGTIVYTSGTTGHPKGVRRAQPTPEQAAVTNRSLALIFGFAGRAPGRIVSVMPGDSSAPGSAPTSICSRVSTPKTCCA
jgi:long-chain acyl-CoA synthetase